MQGAALAEICCRVVSFRDWHIRAVGILIVGQAMSGNPGTHFRSHTTRYFITELHKKRETASVAGGWQTFRDTTNVCYNRNPKIQAPFSWCPCSSPEPVSAAGQPAQPQTRPTTTFYRNKSVHLKIVAATTTDIKDSVLPLTSFLLKVRTLQHINLNPFIGILQSPGGVQLVEEHCPRGDLPLLYKAGCKIDNFAFRRGLVADLLKGLKYIHESSVKYHGDLRPCRCLLDSRFTLKLSGTGYDRVTQILRSGSGDKGNSHQNASEWTAPEHRKIRKKGTAQADIYAFGLILQQLIADFELKFNRPTDRTRTEATKLKLPADRFPESLEGFLRECLVENPGNRPTITSLSNRYFRAVGHQQTSAVGHVLRRLESYAQNLEANVAERTQQLVTEQRRCDALLREMLPENVVSSLRRGIQPPPESFDAVTISFTDIVGFAEIVATVLPEKVIAFLTSAHGLFDDVIMYHDVYKVESIGDSYLTASGLPVRNGSRHAEETCRMAIQFHEAFLTAYDEVQAAARSGIHTGPCVAAVVGLKRPRYCLFGDTVNTASRMESHSEGGKIQISMATKSLLQTDNVLKTVFRGMVQVKGKGEMETFWLETVKAS